MYSEPSTTAGDFEISWQTENDYASARWANVPVETIDEILAYAETLIGSVTFG